MFGTLLEYINENYVNLLIEGRVEDAREKYPDLTDEDFEYLLSNQPAGSNNKYLMWSCARVDELLENDLDRTALSVVMQAVRLFDANKQRLQKKDLYQYKTALEVEEAVDKLGGPTKGQKAKQALSDTDVVYEDDQFQVVRPYTTEASCKYGSNTNWCIAAQGHSNYYSRYSQGNNKFYFVIDKNGETWDNQNRRGNRNSKFAIVIQEPVGDNTSTIQVFDANDAQVGLSAVIKHCGSKWPAIWEKIKEHVAKNPETREVVEARKETEELAKDLLDGKRLTKDSLEKIAKNSTLTPQLVSALINRLREYNGPRDYSDPTSATINQLAERASQLDSKSAAALVEFIKSTKPTGESYWNGRWPLMQVLRNAPFASDDFKRIISNADDETLGGALQNPRFPQDSLADLATRVNEIKNREIRNKVYLRLIANGTITPDQLRTASKDIYVRSDVFNNSTYNQNLTPELLSVLELQSGEEVKRFLAIPNVTPELAAETISKYWQKLKKYDLYEILKTVNLPKEMLEKIWADKDQHMRVTLLQNPSIGEENLIKFSQSRNSAYRFAVAHNPETPSNVLQQLAGDESASTRSAVAAHPKTPKETLKVLAADEATVVRASVASNSATPANVLNALRRDSDSFVKKAAAKTLKTLTTTESIIREMLSMRSLIVEELEDEDNTDIMNPSWRKIPPRSIEKAEFICVFLLQNNGHATREEIEDALRMWRGNAASKDIWKTNKYSDEILRGSTAGGKGWYWAPPGINKGALFRLTPAGASVAMTVLDRYKNNTDRIDIGVNSATAKPGRTYYTIARAVSTAKDITNFIDGELSVVKLQTNRDGTPYMRGGNNAVKATGRSGGSKFFKYVSSTGEVQYIRYDGLPNVALEPNTPVEYVRPFFGYEGADSYSSDYNLAIVKDGERFLLMQFPLWIKPRGETPDAAERETAPPVRKSPPPRELTGAPAPAREPNAAPAAPRGPKTTYKIYGKHRGAPAHTRLKGQAYVAPANTRFKNGEQAVLTPDDGKLKVKKPDSDHTQTWEPSDG